MPYYSLVYYKKLLNTDQFWYSFCESKFEIGMIYQNKSYVCSDYLTSAAAFWLAHVFVAGGLEFNSRPGQMFVNVLVKS